MHWTVVVCSVLFECCDVGSERQKVAEGEGERLKEAGSINRSLTSLGLVIKKLVEGNGAAATTTQRTHIPYRDSRLTFLLQVNHNQLPSCTRSSLLVHLNKVGCQIW